MSRLLLTVAAAALLSSTAPGVRAAFAAEPAPATAEAVQPVDAAERKAVIEDLAKKLADNFVFPEVGARYAAMLRANLASGAYDTLADPDAFAAKVSDDLQAVSPDGHLRLRTREGYGLDKPRAGAPARAPLKGLIEAKMIGDVAYLNFDVFNGDPETLKTLKAFLLAHQDAKALVIDGRQHHGGGLNEMDVIFPLIFDRAQTLVRMDSRASAAEGGPEFAGLKLKPSPAEFVRHDHEVAPDAAHTGLQHVPVYYLTSNKTASAAEHLALAFKHTHRATLIGETTRGAGHYGGVMEIDKRFAAFIPVGRTYDPDTNWDWEGKGVPPDVAVPADQALAEALKRARAAGANPGD